LYIGFTEGITLDGSGTAYFIHFPGRPDGYAASEFTFIEEVRYPDGYADPQQADVRTSEVEPRNAGANVG
jgi:hypothetical protein